ncbi:MAG TPA: glutaminyl-peptide cyclotransferase [Jiangellaceae bacterium]|nr:glutaminyl-peptide cyclotransferase [Jiangellaceae bacterium]
MKPAAVGLAAAVGLGAAVAVVVGMNLADDTGTDATSDLPTGDPTADARSGDAGNDPTAGSLPDCPALDPPAVAAAGPVVVPESAGAVPAAYTVEVIDRTPHDEMAFTQGLIHAGGLIYEGTGLYGESLIRLIEADTGDVLAEETVDESLFGEGVAGHGGRLYQLTWREEEVLVRDRCSLAETGRMGYEGEGWGLTGDGSVLWRSDGTDTLSVHDPDDFVVTSTVDVHDRGRPVTRLNELELVDGQILANVWQTPWIARIDPRSGEVTGWIDGSPLVEEIGSNDPEAVLNGIAVDGGSGRLWLTGKRWPTIFEVRVVPAADLPPPGGLG